VAASGVLVDGNQSAALSRSPPHAAAATRTAAMETRASRRIMDLSCREILPAARNGIRTNMGALPGGGTSQEPRAGRLNADEGDLREAWKHCQNAHEIVSVATAGSGGVHLEPTLHWNHLAMDTRQPPSGGSDGERTVTGNIVPDEIARAGIRRARRIAVRLTGITGRRSAAAAASPLVVSNTAYRPLPISGAPPMSVACARNTAGSIATACRTRRSTA